MNGSKSRTTNTLTAEKLQRIIQNVRSAPRSNEIERHSEKNFPQHTEQLKISCRKLTAHEIDKLINSVPSVQPQPSSTSELCTISSTNLLHQVVQDAPLPSPSDEQLQLESDISFSSTERNTLSHSADIEDNLEHSNVSLFTSSSQTLRASCSQLSCDSTPPPTPAFAFRPIDPVSSEEYQSYGETSRSDDVDRPIMQVKVRPLTSGAQQQKFRPVAWRRCQQQQSDDEPPLIDFRQIERNTRRKRGKW